MRRRREVVAATLLRPNRQVTPVTLGLQGGGSHGAFQWGVIEELLESPSLRIAAVSGASAGAMNAAILAQGLALGGPERAKELLEVLWRRVAAELGTPGVQMLHMVPWPWSVQAMRDFARGAGSPIRQPFATNPLRNILVDLLEPCAFGSSAAPSLVVSATRVRSGEARLFHDSEVTVDALLASACLPQLFPTVEIDGEAYWDGGYSSNPPLRPLIEAGAPADILVVTTTPLERPELPATRAEVLTRAAELAFGTAMRQELRSLAVAQRLLADLRYVPRSLTRLRDARLHMIVAEKAFQEMRGRGRLDASWAFLSELRTLGRETTRCWLDANRAAIGERSTVDLNRFAGPTLQLDPKRSGDAA